VPEYEIDPKTNEILSETDPKPNPIFLYTLMTCLVYPLIYDGAQLLKMKLAYLSDPANYIDILHIGLGYYNIHIQGKNDYTWSLEAKVVMIIVVVTCLVKTFLFMRIVKTFSYIVTMIISVIIELRIFIMFFIIIVLFFSLVFSVLSKRETGEYRYIGPFLSNFLYTLRLSLGDFDFEALTSDPDHPELTMPAGEQKLYFFVWVLAAIYSLLIFLTFMIAQVSDVY